ncbi:F-box only protein 27 isoform X4 [Callithrix jacchus]
MSASASRCRAARVPAPEPEPEGALDLSQMPPELLLVVLSHVPPRTLLGRCRQVCRGWRDLVDSQALWLLILARDHSATGRALLQLARSCQSASRNARPCPLGRFCARRPIGRNLIRNPCGQEGLRKWMVKHGGDGWVVEENRTTVRGAPSQTCFVTSFSWCRKKQVLDLEEEGLWPELLDSGRIEICVSDWWGARHDSGCRYRLLVQLLDANQTVLDKFSAVPDPIPQWNNNVCLHDSLTVPSRAWDHWLGPLINQLSACTSLAYWEFLGPIKGPHLQVLETTRRSFFRHIYLLQLLLWGTLPY